MEKRQIFFTSPGVAEVQMREENHPGIGEVLTRMEFTAVSGGTEKACLLGLPNVQGSFPRSLGYCGVGHVVEIGEGVTSVKIGDRVLVYHGCHSDYNVRPESEITKVEDDSLSSEEAALVIIATMGLGGVRKLNLEIGESAMVMGLGLLGVFALQFCRVSGAYPLIAADLSSERRELALRLGADVALDPSDPHFTEKVKEITGTKGVAATVEVTGAAVALRQALDCASFMGRIALLGCTRVSDCEIDFYQQVHKPGITLIGAHNFVRPKTESYPHHWTHADDCRAVMNLICGGRISVKPVISRIVAPEAAPEVYRELATSKNFPLGTLFDWRK